MRTVHLLGHGKLYSLNFFQVINESFYRLRESVRKVYQLKLTYKQLVHLIVMHATFRWAQRRV